MPENLNLLKDALNTNAVPFSLGSLVALDFSFWWKYLDLTWTLASALYGGPPWRKSKAGQNRLDFAFTE